MFKALLGLALAAPAFAIIDDAIGTQCHRVVTDDLTVFIVDDVEKMTADYSANVSGDDKSGTQLIFNYCTYLEDVDDVYAVYQEGTGSSAQNTVVANKQITTSDNIRDSDEKITGVQFTQGSDTACGSAGKKYSMTTKLMCDETITGQGTATVESVTLVDGCDFQVTLKHKDGCPDFAADLTAYVNWLEDNEWFLGIMYLIVGPLLAIFGLQWFPYVTAILIAFFIFGLCVSLGLAFSLMNSTGGMVAVLVVGAILGIVIGILIKRKIWIMVALLGLVAGFFSGSLIFALISTASGWTDAWGWWVISILMAIVGCLLSYKLGRPVILFATSFVGSYLFMRAFTLFFPGHWPSEAKLMSDIGSVQVDNIFWVFVGVFVVTFIASLVVQNKRIDKTHEDLSDDNYNRVN